MTEVRRARAEKFRAGVFCPRAARFGEKFTQLFCVFLLKFAAIYFIIAVCGNARKGGIA